MSTANSISCVHKPFRASVKVSDGLFLTGDLKIYYVVENVHLQCSVVFTSRFKAKLRTYIYIQWHTYMHTHTYTQTYIQTYIHTFIHTYIHTYILHTYINFT